MAEELRVETRDGWRVYFSTARTIETQAKVLREIIDDKITEDNIAQLEYIDLRIKGKASFRFKDYKRREELKRELEDKLESLETKVLGAQKKKEKKKKKKE